MEGNTLYGLLGTMMQTHLDTKKGIRYVLERELKQFPVHRGTFVDSTRLDRTLCNAIFLEVVITFPSSSRAAILT